MQVSGIGHGLMVTIPDSWVRIPEKSMVVTARASDLNSLLHSHKVISQGANSTNPHEVNNVKYKRKQATGVSANRPDELRENVVFV